MRKEMIKKLWMRKWSKGNGNEREEYTARLGNEGRLRVREGMAEKRWREGKEGRHRDKCEGPEGKRTD